MTTIKLILTGARARAEVAGDLTSGMVGLPVTLEYDDAWNGLTKKLVCRSGDRYDPPEKGAIRIVHDIGDTAVVAWEVMLPDRYLYLGVEGYNADGSLVMPTTWVECGRIYPGANDNADSPEEAPRVWARLESDIDRMQRDALTGEDVTAAIEQYQREHPFELPPHQHTSGTVRTTIRVGAALYRPAYNPNTQLCFRWTSGMTSACIAPFAIHLFKGATYTAELADDSAYQFYFQVYRCSHPDADFSYLPESIMTCFPGSYEKLVDTGFLSGAYSYTPEEYNLAVHIGFRRKDQGTITENDLAVMGNLFSLQCAMPEYVPANLGAENAVRALVTDAEGNVIAGDPVDRMPDYWQAYLEEKLPAIRAQIAAGGADTEVFAYFTDHHIGCVNNLDNANNTRHIIDFLRRHTPIRKVFFGGDILNTTASQTHDHVLRWLWAFHDDYIRRGVYPVIGNHEISTQYDTSGNHISFDEAYAILFREAEHTADTGKKLYYFLDNPSQKIRYIVLDTESEAIGGNTAQLQWFTEALGSMDKDWTAVMFAHNFSNVSGYDTPDNPVITQIAGAYNRRTAGSAGDVAWDFSHGKGTVACLICGHIHLDGSGVNNGILVINVTTDCGANVYNAAPDNTNGANRHAGDVSEQAVELFFVNTAEKTIKTIRLGYGEDREWNYGSGSQPVNPFDQAAVILGSLGEITASTPGLNYYYESGIKQAVLNPVFFYVEAGNTLKVSLSDYSGYRFAVHRYSCGESDRDTDFTVTEGTSREFDVPSAKVYDSGWQSADFTLQIEEACAVGLLFRNTAYSALTDADTAAIALLLNAAITPTD